MGINLSAGQFHEEVAMGDSLADMVRAERRNLTVYALATDEAPGVVESQGLPCKFLSGSAHLHESWCPRGA